jgi:hypothetical protein
MSGSTVLVVNGDAAAGALRAAGLVNDSTETSRITSGARPSLLVLRDVLSCGSLRDANLSRSLEAWQEAREAFWRRVWADALHWGWVDEPFGAVARLPSNLYAEAEALEQADRVIACVGAGLSDQLMLAFLVAWFDVLGLDDRRLWVAAYVQPGAPGEPPAGLPRLDPEALAAGWSPRSLGMDEWRKLGDFWADYGLGDEPARNRWLGREGVSVSGGLAPTLATALAAWASREPAPPGGLAAWDRALLEAGSPDPLPLRAVLGRALRSSGVRADPVGDLVLLHRIVMLSNRSDERAWWTLDAPGEADTTCALTAYGTSLRESGSQASSDPRTRDWLQGLAAAR